MIQKKKQNICVDKVKIYIRLNLQNYPYQGRCIQKTEKSEKNR